MTACCQNQNVQSDAQSTETRWRQHKASRWESLLAAEGLSPLDGPSGMLSRRGARVREQALMSGKPEAVDTYLEWAGHVLEAHDWTRARQSHVVWELHVAAQSFSAIAEATGLSRGKVARIIAAVTAEHGPPPVRNPWKKRPDEERRMPVQRLRYSKIKLRKGGLVQLPGRAVGNDHILPDKGEQTFEGLPHVGGIDVFRDGQVITVPWWLIEQANRPEAT